MKKLFLFILSVFFIFFIGCSDDDDSSSSSNDEVDPIENYIGLWTASFSEDDEPTTEIFNIKSGGSTILCVLYPDGTHLISLAGTTANDQITIITSEGDFSFPISRDGENLIVGEFVYAKTSDFPEFCSSISSSLDISYRN